jgi:hypothetical protein
VRVDRFDAFGRIIKGILNGWRRATGAGGSRGIIGSAPIYVATLGG